MNNYGGCFSSETLLRYNQLLRGISDLSFRNLKFVVFLTHPHLLLNCYLSNSILFVSGEYFYCCIICCSLSGWFHKNIYISIICYIKQIFEVQITVRLIPPCPRMESRNLLHTQILLWRSFSESTENRMEWRLYFHV